MNIEEICATCKYDVGDDCYEVVGSCIDCDKWEALEESSIKEPVAPPMQKDMKYDVGKTDMSLLEYFPLALEALCKVSEKGCEKYRRGSFTEVKNPRKRYTAAMLRHYFQEGPGDEPDLDNELELPHDFMTMWNAICRVELRLRGFELED